MGKILKKAAVMEDLATGVGEVTQERAGTTYSNLGKIDQYYAVTTLAKLNSLVAEGFKYAKYENKLLRYVVSAPEGEYAGPDGYWVLEELPVNATNRLEPIEEALGSIALAIQPATTTTKGIVEKATPEEAQSATPDKYPDAAGVHAAFNKYGLGTMLPQVLTDINQSGLVGAGFFCALGDTAGMPLNIYNATVLNMYRRATGSQSELDGAQVIIGKDGSSKTRVAFRFAWDAEANTVPFIELYHSDNFAPVANLGTVSSSLPLAASQGPVIAEMIGTKLDSSAKATVAEALAGLIDTKYTTPKTVGLFVNQYGIGNTTPETVADFNNVGVLGNGIYRTIGTSLSAPLGVVQGNLFNMRRSEGAFNEIDGAQLLLGQTSAGKKVAAFRTAYDVFASTVPFIELYHTDNFAPVANLSSVSSLLPLAASLGPVLVNMIGAKLDSSAPAVNSLALGGVLAADWRQKIDGAFIRGSTTTIEESNSDSSGSASFKSVNADTFVTFHSGGVHAFNFGYSVARGKVGIGGWSLGNNFYELLHSGDLISAQNLSGATVNSNATTAGSNLSPAQYGTWRNISGNDILNNGYGLFKRD